jgi:gliding motility-associated-like protein
MKKTYIIITLLLLAAKAVNGQLSTSLDSSCTCVINGNMDIFIPNLITCNGDGHNDSFSITGPESEITLEIYNSWGEFIYRKENYLKEIAWDGYKESDGMYYYILYFPEGIQYKGWVQLMH